MYTIEKLWLQYENRKYHVNKKYYTVRVRNITGKVEAVNYEFKQTIAGKFFSNK